MPDERRRPGATAPESSTGVGISFAMGSRRHEGRRGSADCSGRGLWVGPRLVPHPRVGASDSAAAGRAMSTYATGIITLGRPEDPKSLFGSGAGRPQAPQGEERSRALGKHVPRSVFRPNTWEQYDLLSRLSPMIDKGQVSTTCRGVPSDLRRQFDRETRPHLATARAT